MFRSGLVFSTIISVSKVLKYFTKNTMEEMIKFSLKDYSCIGFDLDNTLARYKLSNLIELEYYIMADFLIKQRHYPGDILLKPLDPNFLLKGLVIDDKFGNVVKIAADGAIVSAAHGTKWLNEEELLNYYPTRHRQFIDDYVDDPIEASNRCYNDKMRFSLDYFDIANSLVYARAVDTVEQHRLHEKITEIWQDIIDCLLYMFVSDHFHQDIGGYYPEIRRHPEKYYQKCSQSVLNWLLFLKSSGIRLFLISGAYAGSAHITAAYTIGENWQDYFDIIIFGARKPGFFTSHRDFLRVEGYKETHKISENQLQLGGIYSIGNWPVVKIFLTNLCKSSDPKFLYIGDNLLQDVYTPNVCDKIDTLCICEELEAENAFGFPGSHPDKNVLKSTLWGSFFFSDSSTLSYWGYLMKNYSRIFVPSIEYLAKFPVDYEFVSNNS